MHRLGTKKFNGHHQSNTAMTRKIYTLFLFYYKIYKKEKDGCGLLCAHFSNNFQPQNVHIHMNLNNKEKNAMSRENRKIETFLL